MSRSGPSQRDAQPFEALRRWGDAVDQRAHERWVGHVAAHAQDGCHQVIPVPLPVWADKPQPPGAPIEAGPGKRRPHTCHAHAGTLRGRRERGRGARDARAHDEDVHALLVRAPHDSPNPDGHPVSSRRARAPSASRSAYALRAAPIVCPVCPACTRGQRPHGQRGAARRMPPRALRVAPRAVHHIPRAPRAAEPCVRQDEERGPHVQRRHRK